MRIAVRVLFVSILTTLVVAIAAIGQQTPAVSPRILSASSVYFDNQTGSEAVGQSALTRLKKWRKFQIVNDSKKADLIFLLSADPDTGGNIIFADGKTGTIEDGHITKDPVPDYSKQSRPRYANLTALDAKTGDKLWSDKRLWSGVISGPNSVGESLIKELQNQIKKH
jgi:hypothetical protein